MDGHELIPFSTMQHIKTQSSKINLQGKLRLKRSSSHSTQAISSADIDESFENEARQHSNCSNDQSIHKENVKDDSSEDSLADFKSPKRETACRTTLNKYKIEAEKTKKTIIKSKAKSAVKFKKSNTNQLSIESSLLRPQKSNQNQSEIKEAIICPVCLKPFRDDTACTNHMKSCAAKNNVSVKQLLEAKRLQDRQAQERKAMGLLAAPIVPEKKKAFRSKNFSTGDDPQLQLVLAMSESLYEAERMVELDEAVLLAGIPSECIREMNDEERKRTLQNFGFTTNKPITDVPISKPRKKKFLAPTILQTRSKEDKDRVLTERIACILTGEDAFTQTEGNAAISLENKTPTVIKSKLLTEIEKTDNKLWDHSRLTKQYQDFYVDTLKSHFAKVKQRPIESETHECLMEIPDKHNTLTLNTSIVYEPMDLDTIINNRQIKQDNINCETLNMNEWQNSNFELVFVQSFCDNWKEALNDSSASDVVVFVKNNEHIYAHKLVFQIQCPNILLDILPLDEAFHPPIEKKLCWLDKERVSALAFLEFIYSGVITKYINIFYQEELVQQVEELARLYKKANLFTYIRNKQQELKFYRKDLLLLRSSNNMQEDKCTNNQFGNSSGNLKSAANIPFELQVTCTNPLINIDKPTTKLVQKQSVSNNLLTNQLIDRQITASPDLFDSDEDETNNSKIKIVDNYSNLENEATTYDDNIKKEIDDVQDPDHDAQHLSSQETLVNLSRSVSPLENIHEAITPPSGLSPRGSHRFEENPNFGEQGIAEAITPKRQSLETIVGIKQEIFKSADLNSAVTPEYISPAELNNSITPRKFVYAGIELQNVVSQDQDHIDESIYTAVTPPRHQEESVQNIDVHKVKSELSMFIEKVQRRNAKYIMDTDSETDTPDNRMRQKNPFLKRDQDDSYRYLRSEGDQKYHKAISLLEKDVLDDQKVQKNLENIQVDSNESMKNKSKHVGNVNPSRIVVSDSQNSTKEDASLSVNEIQNITVDENQMSMYTRYKESNKCDNSIAFYRKQLNFSGQKIGTANIAYSNAEKNFVDNSVPSKTSGSAVSQIGTKKKPKLRIIEDITLVSDSDEEESPLRTFLRDKNKKEIHRSSPVSELNKKDTKIDLQTLVSNIDNRNKLPSEFVNEPLEPNKITKVFCSRALKTTESRSKIIDLSVDSDEDASRDERTFPNDAVDPQSDYSLNVPKAFTMEFQASMNKRKILEEAEKKSEDIDAEISKILETSQGITTVDKNLNGNNNDNNDDDDNDDDGDGDQIDDKEECHEDKLKRANTGDVNFENKMVNLSPIYIVSSPELCKLDKSTSHISKRNVSENNCNKYSQNSEGSLALGENGDFDLLACSVYDVKTPPKEIVRSVKSLGELSTVCPSVRKLTYDQLPLNSVESIYLNDLTNSRNDKTRTLTSSPILSQNRRNWRESEDKSSIVSGKLKIKDRSPEYHPEDIRQLKKKSASTSTLTEKFEGTGKCILQRSSSFVTPKHTRKASPNHENMTTPPLDYSLLDTPNLQNELKKFGLKPQNRTKAKALLTHIYKETHSNPPSASLKRTSNSDSSNEKDEPPTKRQFVKKTTRKSDDKNKEYSTTEQISENCSFIAEEMDFDDPDMASIFQNPVSIKDAFFHLIKTNRELYNKVLTYEPLPLEVLHLILKQNGFKCKINDLMDFLDEQCITFQVKSNKVDRTKNRVT